MSRHTAKITFRIKAPVVASDEQPVYIAGNHPALGDWQPDRVALQKVAEGRWELGLEFPKAMQLEFKLTRGSWASEEVVKSGEVKGNRLHEVQEDQVLNVKVNNWRDILFRSKKGIVGQVRYHRNVRSPLLKHKRDLIVWLPPSYDKLPQKRYPVLYMHDGQNLFDPATAFAGVDWRMDETATRLIKSGKIQEIIIVGLYNTPARLDEYADTVIGRNYMRFLAEEAKPFIDKAYRTLPTRENTAAMGSSMGGLISLYLVFSFPEIFAKAGCLSSSLFWHDHAVFDFISSQASVPKNVKIYIDHGGAGDEGKYAPDFRRLRDLLIEKGCRPGIDLEYYFDKRGDHSERSWARRVKQPLRFLFGVGS